MKNAHVVSDQLYNWSDREEKGLPLCPAPETRRAPPEAPRPLPSPARLPHRTLQAVRQARLRLRPRERPRPQVLSLGQSPGTSPRDGLRPLRVPPNGQAAPGQPRPGPRNPGGGLPDQSRAPQPPGEALGVLVEVRASRGIDGLPGSGRDFPPRRQHGRGSPRRGACRHGDRRGQ